MVCYFDVREQYWRGCKAGWNVLTYYWLFDWLLCKSNRLLKRVSITKRIFKRSDQWNDYGYFYNNLNLKILIR